MEWEKPSNLLIRKKTTQKQMGKTYRWKAELNDGINKAKQTTYPNKWEERGVCC